MPYGPFQHGWPYSNFHDLNLDWILDRIKKIMHEWAETKNEWEEVQSNFDDLYKYVHNYFDNLDIQEEINEKIDAMYSDGTLGALFTQMVCVNNVRAFGAAGNANYFNAGTNTWYESQDFTTPASDDTSAFQSALDAAAKNGFPVLIPTGRYLISNTINIKTHMTVYGSGTNSSVLIPAYGMNEYCFNIDGGTGAIQNVNLHDISFNAQHAPNAKGISAKFLIYNSGFSNIKFEYFDNTVLRFESGNDASENITINNINVFPLSQIKTPWFDLNRVHETTFDNCHLVNFVSGIPYPSSLAPAIKASNISGVSFRNCDFFYMQGQPAISINNYNGVVVTGCTFENINSDSAISLSGSSIDLATFFSFFGNRRNIGNYLISVNTASTLYIADASISVSLSGLVYNSIIMAMNVSGSATRSIVLSYSNKDGDLETLKVGSSTSITIEPQKQQIKLTPPGLTTYSGIQAFAQYSSPDTSLLHLIVNGKAVQTFNTNGIVFNSVRELPEPGYAWRYQIIIYNYEPYLCVNDANGSWQWKKLAFSV